MTTVTQWTMKAFSLSAIVWQTGTVLLSSATPFVAAAQSASTTADSVSVDTLSLRIVLSTGQRRLWVLNASDDTVFTAPVAVGSGTTMTWRGQRWSFETPRGEFRVLSKEKDPVWIPPTWNYVEEARKHGLSVAELRRGTPVALDDGQVLTIRRDTVGVVGRDSVFRVLPVAEHIVFRGTLYIPPFGTANRRVPGTLGRYRLNLGNGLGLHGTPEHESIPKPVTHGCVRLHDDDIEWLYRNVPVGARVTIF